MAEKETRVKSTMGGKSKPKKRKKKSKGVKSMKISHAANGGYIAEHEAPEGEEQEQLPHALSSMDDLHSHLDEHMAQPPQQAQAPVQQVTGT